MLQGGGLFRSGLNGDVSNIFFENNNAALSGGGLFEVRGSSHTFFSAEFAMTV